MQLGKALFTDFLMRRLVLLGLLAAAACSESEYTGPDRISMTGTWRQSADLLDSLSGDRHINLGQFTLVQAGATFRGEGSQGLNSFCTAPNTAKYNGPLADPSLFPVEGALSGREVSFSRTDNLVSCTYDGSFVDGSSTRMTGTATCAYTQNGINHVFSGPWQADKQ